MKKSLRQTILSVLVAVTCFCSSVLFMACNPLPMDSSTPEQSTPADSTPNESTPDSSANDNVDPYENVSASEFYASYTVAKNNKDAYYRSQHGFLSGELTVPDQAPTLSANRPKNGEKYIRNSEMLFSADGNTYTVVDAFGNPAFNVYRDGAYITLEEVAAYVYAFGTYPKNHSPNKKIFPFVIPSWLVSRQICNHCSQCRPKSTCICRD